MILVHVAWDELGIKFKVRFCFSEQLWSFLWLLNDLLGLVISLSLHWKLSVQFTSCFIFNTEVSSMIDGRKERRRNSLSLNTACSTAIVFTLDNGGQQGADTWSSTGASLIYWMIIGKLQEPFLYFILTGSWFRVMLFVTYLPHTEMVKIDYTMPARCPALPQSTGRPVIRRPSLVSSPCPGWCLHSVS